MLHVHNNTLSLLPPPNSSTTLLDFDLLDLELDPTFVSASSSNCEFLQEWLIRTVDLNAPSVALWSCVGFHICGP